MVGNGPTTVVLAYHRGIIISAGDLENKVALLLEPGSRKEYELEVCAPSS